MTWYRDGNLEGRDNNPEGPDLLELEKTLGVAFKNRDLLLLAVTHSSYDPVARAHRNERLEFLGDAVLKLALCDDVFKHYADASEGEMSSIVSFGASEGMLAEIASRLGIGRFMRMGKSLETTGGREQPSILADAMEAVLGAIYLDRGFGEAALFVIRELSSLLPYPAHIKPWKTSKTTLQEVLQKTKKLTPSYELVSETGPDHAKVFRVRVVLAGEILAEGEGRSKKEAEEDAAARALARFFGKIR